MVKTIQVGSVQAEVSKYLKKGYTVLIMRKKNRTVASPIKVVMGKRGRPPSKSTKKSRGGGLWTKSEIKQALRVYWTEQGETGYKRLAKKLGRSYGSVSAKISNIRGLLTGAGFANAGQRTKEVVKEFVRRRRING